MQKSIVISAEISVVQIYVDLSSFRLLYEPQNEIPWDFCYTAKKIYMNSIISTLKENYLDPSDTTKNIFLIWINQNVANY